MQLASREGLEGLTLGGLAAELEVHKSSVFALFGSEEELQLATLAAARAILIEQVSCPGARSEEGLPRLLAIGRGLVRLPLRGGVRGRLLPMRGLGGDGRAAGAGEGCGRGGDARMDRRARANVEAASRAGTCDADADPAAMAFGLNALGMAANWQRQLLEDQRASSTRGRAGKPSSTRPPPHERAKGR